jgi:hypothetical protein
MKRPAHAVVWLLAAFAGLFGVAMVVGALLEWRASRGGQGDAVWSLLALPLAGLGLLCLVVAVHVIARPSRWAFRSLSAITAWGGAAAIAQAMDRLVPLLHAWSERTLVGAHVSFGIFVALAVALDQLLSRWLLTQADG